MSAIIKLVLLALAAALLLTGALAHDEIDFYWHAYVGPCRTDLECLYHCPREDRDCDGGPQ